MNNCIYIARGNFLLLRCLIREASKVLLRWKRASCLRSYNNGRRKGVGVGRGFAKLPLFRAHALEH